MRLTRLTPLLVLLGAIALGGCGKTSPMGATSADPGAVPNDQAQVTQTVAAAPQLVEDGLADSADPTTIASAPGFAAIQPITWWRNITDVDRTLEFTFSDPDTAGRPTTAEVTIRKRLTGRFNVLIGLPGTDGTAMDSTREVIHKPLEDHWVRKVLLKRVRLAGEDHEPIWRIVAASGVQVTSKGATTNIVSLRIQDGGLDTTITDPLAFQRLRRIVHLAPDTQVTLTVTTGRNDDVVFLRHAERRFRFHNNGDNTYTGVWRTGVFWGGIHHFGVNAFSNGTLFDDQAPYDSQAWLFPFAFEPEVIAETMP